MAGGADDGGQVTPVPQGLRDAAADDCPDEPSWIHHVPAPAISTAAAPATSSTRPRGQVTVAGATVVDVTVLRCSVDDGNPAISPSRSATSIAEVGTGGWSGRLR